MCSESPRGKEGKVRLHGGRKQWRSQRGRRGRGLSDKIVELDLVSLLLGALQKDLELSPFGELLPIP